MVGAGEIVKMDRKGGITIPSNLRKAVGKNIFKVELVDKNTITLRVLEDKNELIEKIKAIKLTGDKERRFTDTATVKDKFGGLKN
ncbi:MAG: hypothetical protein ACPLGZ_02390 [Candidatus Pelagibacter ubique]